MKACTTFLFLTLAIASSGQQVAARPEDAIHHVFEALSEGSITKMQDAVTPDVKILEHGVVWTMDSLRFYLTKKRPDDFRRTNSFEFFQSEVSGNMAFVSYHNRADIHANNKDRIVKWLESAVLVRDGRGWKVKMLHSTRLE
ncbi:MAG TPA: nuclear transport factor 2 family protein [Chryseosolibacter sp.]